MSRGAGSEPAWAKWLVPLIVLLITIKTTYGVLDTFDVGFDDETGYLDAALFPGKRALPLSESSPLYPLWYRLLSVLQPDAIKLYFLNWFVLTASLPVLLYVLARRSGASLLTSSLIAIAWSVSYAVMTWPYVSKFATVILALGAIGATYVPRDRRLAAAVTVAAMAFAAYARAELALPSIAFGGVVALWALWTLIKSIRAPKTGARRRLRWGALIAIVLGALLPLGLRKVFGDPHQGGRAFFAFAQHYALNVVEDRKLYVDVWTTWHFYTREAFPKASTIPEAFQENPAAFIWHLKRNLTTHPHTIEQLLKPMTFIPTSISTLLTASVVWIGCAGVASFLFLRRARGAPVDKRLVTWLPLYIAIALATFPSTMLVYPREHYLIPLTWLSLAVFASFCNRWSLPSYLSPQWLARAPFVRRAFRFARVALAPVIVLSLLVLLPSRRPVFPSVLAATEPPPPKAAIQENVRTVEVLRSLHLQGHHVIVLESDHARGVYAGWDFLRIGQSQKAEDFWPFMDRHKIDIIILNDRLCDDVRFKSDTAFQKFVDGTGDRRNFIFIPVEGTRAVVAVKQTLLSR